MSKKHYHNIIILIVLSTIFLSLSVISAEDIDNDKTSTDTAEDNTEFEDSYEIDEETPYGSNDNNILKSQDEKIFKSSQTDNIEVESTDDSIEENEGDCSSSIVQKNENETAISFRLDSGAKLNLYITNNSAIKQFKTQGSYFFHVMMTPNGWVVGTGGLDSGTENQKIESIAMRMINNNNIDAQSVNEIFKIKQNIGRGHFIIKAPNGTYAAIQYFYGKYTKEMGVLKSGEYIVCPNDPKYYRKGSYISTTGTTNLSDATRYLASHDRYGTLRSQITTLEYVNRNHQRSINVYLANDDGRYVGCNSRSYCNDFNITGKIIRSTQIPVINNKLHAATYTYRDKNVKTFTTTNSIYTNGSTVTLKANVVDDLSANVNEGKVIFKINGQTIKDDSGNVIKAKVTNGKATYRYNIPYIWKNNFTYTAKYIPTEYYRDSSSKESAIITNLIKTSISIDSKSSNKITVTTNVNYTNNNVKTTGGMLIYKINGVTLKDNNNNIIKTSVKNGISTLTIDKRYSPNKYTLTVSYIRSDYRQDFQKEFTINPINTRIVLNPITTKSLNTRINGKLLDANNVTVNGIVKACVKINGITLKNSNNETIIFNVTNGIIAFNITLPSNLKARTYNFTLQTQERKEYRPTTARTTLTLQI
ncbi:MAG: hypothetical protein BZ137_08525 [Methanosphaera sp. rholeuAM130]|nr:MAG: hypothetical protein BZ137_08525 [Methanosphaera sp. rholeuAM130]